VVSGVVHYCVANMPGAVPQTSTTALTNATLPHALTLARLGAVGAARASVHLARGYNTYKGSCVCAPVGEAHRIPSVSLESLL
jgi:alanine dehydrogenase